jgi:hypothetical protein
MMDISILYWFKQWLIDADQEFTSGITSGEEFVANDSK